MHAPVSVIIPCYQCAATIERAVESVTSQTLLPEEVLLVDDYSNDNNITLNALYRLQQHLGDKITIKVIPLPVNQGPGMARNAGWDMATQPWIAFLDADDAWHPKKIEIQYNWVLSHQQITLCAHDTTLFNHEFTDEQLTSVSGISITAKKLLFSNVIHTRSVMMKRDIPFRFANKKRAEDYQLWLDITFSGYACWKLPLILAYSFRPEFSSGGLSGNLWAHEKDELNCFLHLFKEKRLTLVLYLATSCFSLMKFFRRCLMVRINRSARVAI